MKQWDLINILAIKLVEPKTRIAKMLEVLTETITEEISNGETIKIVDFWTLSSIRVKSRNWVNPSTWEKIVIPALNRAKFKPSSILKKALNK